MLFWLLVLIACMVAELITVGLTTVWFAGGALIAMIVSLLGGAVWLQWLVFFAVSLLLVIFTRPIAVKYFNKDRLKTNAESVVGRQAVVTEDIDNIAENGAAMIGGQEWSARGIEGFTKIPKGTQVEVKYIEGVKVFVTPVIALEKE